jgi:hypothetical protein
MALEMFPLKNPPLGFMVIPLPLGTTVFSLALVLLKIGLSSWLAADRRS